MLCAQKKKLETKSKPRFMTSKVTRLTLKNLDTISLSIMPSAMSSQRTITAVSCQVVEHLNIWDSTLVFSKSLNISWMLKNLSSRFAMEFKSSQLLKVRSLDRLLQLIMLASLKLKLLEQPIKKSVPMRLSQREILWAHLHGLVNKVQFVNSLNF